MEQQTLKTSKPCLVSSALLFSNIKRFFFLPLMHFVILILTCPFMLFVRDGEYYYVEKMSATEQVRMFVRGYLTILNAPVYYMIVSLVMVLAVFSYLFFQKNSYMMHAFPLTRKTMFITNILSAFLMTAVPQILTALITIPMAAKGGGASVGDVCASTLMGLMGTVFFTGVSAFVIMSTGAIVAVPFLYAILNLLPLAITTIVGTLAVPLIFGISFPRYEKSMLITPVVEASGRAASALNNYYDYEVNKYVVSDAFGEMKYFGIMVLAGLIFLLISYAIYSKKQIESTGSLLPMAWTRPVFRWGVVFCTASLMGLFFVAAFNSSNEPKGTAIIYIINYIVFGLVIFFAVQMVIARRFKVFSKKLFAEWGVLTVCLCAMIGLIYADVFNIEKKVPAPGEISEIFINSNNSYTFSKDEKESIEKLTELHQKIIDNKEAIQISNDYNLHPEGGKYLWLDFLYTLENGESVSRSYGFYIYEDDESLLPLFDEICGFFDKPENIYKGIYGDREVVSDAPETINVYGENYRYDGQTYDYFEEEWREDMEIYGQNERIDDKPMATKIWEAFKKDVDEGNVKTFLYSERQAGKGHIHMDLEFNFTEKDDKGYNNYTLYVSVDENSTNIMNALKESGRIKFLSDF